MSSSLSGRLSGSYALSKTAAFISSTDTFLNPYASAYFRPQKLEIKMDLYTGIDR